MAALSLPTSRHDDCSRSCAELPTEIWRIILRQATYVPDLLATTWEHDIDDKIWEGWEGWNYRDDPTVEANMAKCTIVRVCRRWKDIGVEFLYEAILIPFDLHDETRLRNLIQALQSHSDATPSGVGHGWWTKRIDCPGEFFRPPFIDHLYEVLKHCHNLQILRTSTYAEPGRAFPGEQQVQLAQLLQSRFSHSLRRLDVPFGDEAYDGEDLLPVDFTTALPNIPLQSLWLCVHLDSQDAPLHPSLQHITTLALDLGPPLEFEGFPLTWTFTSLRTLELHSADSEHSPALVSFIQRHGHVLRSLSFRWSSFIPVDDLLADLLSNCPSLRSLAFFDQQFSDLLRTSMNMSFPGLSHVGMIAFGGFTHLSTNILRMFSLGIFPDLAVVRLLEDFRVDDYPSKYSEVPPDWQLLSEQMSIHHVRLEDKNGEPIRFDIDAINNAKSYESGPSNLME